MNYIKSDKFLVLALKIVFFSIPILVAIPVLATVFSYDANNAGRVFMIATIIVASPLCLRALIDTLFSESKIEKTA